MVKYAGLAASSSVLPLLIQDKYICGAFSVPRQQTSYLHLMAGTLQVSFLNITGFRDCPLNDLPMIKVLKEVGALSALAMGNGIKRTCQKIALLEV